MISDIVNLKVKAPRAIIIICQNLLKMKTTELNSLKLKIILVQLKQSNVQILCLLICEISVELEMLSLGSSFTVFCVRKFPLAAESEKIWSERYKISKRKLLPIKNVFLSSVQEKE